MTRQMERPLRYLLLSDPHANLEALETCLDLARGKYDQALCLGDLVGYGPDPNAVVELVKASCAVIIRGNHDKACAGIYDPTDFNPLARMAVDWTRNALTPENFGFLRALPSGPVMMEGFQIVHGSPLDEDEYIIGPSQALPLLRGPQIQTVCFGHTHYQGGFMISPQGRYQSLRVLSKENGCTHTLTLENEARYLINPGSVGQPRDGDARAAFAIFDVPQQTVEYYRIPYDLQETQKKMSMADLPEPLIRRLEYGR
jgi:predicted phosphodiesterase